MVILLYDVCGEHICSWNRSCVVSHSALPILGVSETGLAGSEDELDSVETHNANSPNFPAHIRVGGRS